MTDMQADAHGWQPIETAPRDGTVVWVYTAEREGLPAFQSRCAWHPDACRDPLAAPPASPGGAMNDPRPDGYYWASHPEGTHLIVYHDTSSLGGEWWMCGLAHPVDHAFDPATIICPVRGVLS